MLTNQIFTETINPSSIKKLLQFPELLTSWTDERGITRDDKKQIVSILHKIKNKTLSVKYNYSKSLKTWGRVYPEKSLSLGSLERKIRGTLTNGTYIDLDIVNAHPNMILYLLGKYEMPYSNYEFYCENRDTSLKKIMECYNCSRDAAKNFFIVGSYGSSYNSWLEKNNLVDPYINHKKLFNDFQAESKKLAIRLTKTMEKHYNEYRETKNKKYNFELGFLAVVMQNYERQVLETMFEFLQDNTLLENNNCILCHDGIMIKSPSINPELLIKMAQVIKDKHEFTLQIKDKPLEHHLDKLKKVIPLTPEGSPMDLEYFNNLYTYKQKKKYFERYFCLIIHTAEFIKLDISYENGEKKYSHSIMNEKKLITSFKSYLSENLYNIENDSDDKIKIPKPFIHKWLSDSERRCYINIGWIPYNGTYRQDNKRIFNLFNGYSTIITRPLPNNVDKKIAPLLDVLLNLCEGNQKNLDFLIHYLAHRVQKPQEKLPYAIIFTGRQGTGKDTLLYAMGKIFGSQYVNSDSNLQNFVGTHAEGLCEKLMVAFNESQANKSFSVEGIIKTLITEDTISINKKYQSPYKAKNICSILIFSNKQNPIKFDSTSQDRRFIAWKTTDKYAHKKYHKWWTGLYNSLSSDSFISSWYYYLNSIDLKNYIFPTERLKVLTETYQDMCRQQLPPIADWMGDFILPETMEITKIPEQLFYSLYIKWQTKNRPDSFKDSGFIGDKRKFKATIKALGFPIDIKRARKQDGGVIYRFQHSVVYNFLLKKGWLDGLEMEDSEENSIEYVEFDL
tara:strand:+ start:1333 stop:3699 length:2367 start_codon:yes stop_codon:yes gene_type:complete